MYLIIKRILGFILSLIAVIILIPVYLITAIAIKIDDPSGPVLFKQKRFGAHKKMFDIYKFRSMKTDAPHDLATEDIEDISGYLTRTGAFIRKYSIDELPQFLNVVKGDMAIIAPRPALWNQENLIAERDKYVGYHGMTPNDLRPGLTGWAQINGRDNLNDEQKAAYDGYYVKHFGFMMDLRCFLRTFRKVLTHSDVKE
ncbi:MAG: sugar transferase [Solobacterium sp.]|nr:sugar transferase [Solobacterium sp.]